MYIIVVLFTVFLEPSFSTQVTVRYQIESLEECRQVVLDLKEDTTIEKEFVRICEYE